MSEYRLIRGDCLDVLPTLEADSIDLVLADPPYGTTACKWDSVIPFEPMWAGIKHVIKRNAAVVLFGSQPFTSALVMSNPKWFRYEWVWLKSRVTGWLDCKRKPLKAHETVSVFYERLGVYNPQMTPGERHGRGPRANIVRTNETYGAFMDGPQRTHESAEFYPRSPLQFGSVLVPVHPNEKPVALLEYLIRTYTNEGETVLDFTMGSGTTGVACLNTGRRFIGIEKDAAYFDIARQRIEQAAAQQRLAV